MLHYTATDSTYTTSTRHRTVTVPSALSSHGRPRGRRRVALPALPRRRRRCERETGQAVVEACRAHAHFVPPPPADAPPRRKYRKMRIRFDDAMRESNALMLLEWKAMGTARRLQENNDQLLDLLLDFNEQPRVPPRLRYDLRHLSAADTAVPSSEAGHTRHARDAPDALGSLAALEAHVPHTARADLADHAPHAFHAAHVPIDGLDLTVHAPGYLSPTHEEEYLLATDTALEDPAFDPSRQHGRPLRLATAHPPLVDKDLTVRNPDSVYNWLRKHQPQVFLQDKDALALHADALSDKSTHKTASGGGGGNKKAKRESTLARGGTCTPGPRDVHASHDDPDATPGPYDTTKARRKTGSGHGADDDPAYRPKGGHSRPPKRKREDGDTPGGKASAKKKSRASAVVAASAAGG